MNNGKIVKKSSLLRTKTAQFGEKGEVAEVENENGYDSFSNGEEKVKKLQFNNEIEVKLIQSHTEFNMQVFNEKRNQMCGSCTKCLIF
jgi:hypothetical protein